MLDVFGRQAVLEGKAADLVSRGDVEAARAMLTHHSNVSAVAAVSSYQALFETLVARYHDGYQMQVSDSSAALSVWGLGEGDERMDSATHEVTTWEEIDSVGWWRKGGGSQFERIAQRFSAVEVDSTIGFELGSTMSCVVLL